MKWIEKALSRKRHQATYKSMEEDSTGEGNRSAYMYIKLVHSEYATGAPIIWRSSRKFFLNSNTKNLCCYNLVKHSCILTYWFKIFMGQMPFGECTIS